MNSKVLLIHPYETSLRSFRFPTWPPEGKRELSVSHTFKIRGYFQFLFFKKREGGGKRWSVKLLTCGRAREWCDQNHDFLFPALERTRSPFLQLLAAVQPATNEGSDNFDANESIISDILLICINLGSLKWFFFFFLLLLDRITVLYSLSTLATDLFFIMA